MGSSFLKKTFMFFAAAAFTLLYAMPVHADAAPPVEPLGTDGGFPVLPAVLIAAVVIIAVVLYRRFRA